MCIPACSSGIGRVFMAGWRRSQNIFSWLPYGTFAANYGRYQFDLQVNFRSQNWVSILSLSSFFNRKKLLLREALFLTAAPAQIRKQIVKHPEASHPLSSGWFCQGAAIEHRQPFLRQLTSHSVCWGSLGCPLPFQGVGLEYVLSPLSAMKGLCFYSHIWEAYG